MDEVEKLAKELKDTLFGYETRGFESFDFNKEDYLRLAYFVEMKEIEAKKSALEWASRFAEEKGAIERTIEHLNKKLAELRRELNQLKGE